MRGPAPVPPEMTQEEVATARGMTIAEMSNYRSPSSIAHAEAHRAYMAASDRAAVDSGCRSVDANGQRLLSRERAAAHRVLRFPVRTINGLAVKMKVHAAHVFNADELAAAIARDVRRIAKTGA